MTLSSEQRESHYTVEFDEREGWLVITDPGGASAIVAENVAPWFGHFVVRVVGPVPNLWDETWSNHPFTPDLELPDYCGWTDGRWSRCKAGADAQCHALAAPDSTGARE